MAVFDAWLARDGRSAVPVFAEGVLAVTEYRDGFVYSPSVGRRSNTLCLVRGDHAAAFSPALVSLEEAYSQLGGASEGPGR